MAGKYDGLKARGERGEDTQATTNTCTLGFYKGAIALVLPTNSETSYVGQSQSYTMTAPQARIFGRKLIDLADRLDNMLPDAPEDMNFTL